MTLEEQERRAYADGDVGRASLLAIAIDCESDTIEELEHEVDGLKDEVKTLEQQTRDIEREIEDLEEQLEGVRAELADANTILELA